jgi:hypothetical protein
MLDINETLTTDNMQNDDLSSVIDQQNLSPSNSILGEYLAVEAKLLHNEMKRDSLNS